MVVHIVVTLVFIYYACILLQFVMLHFDNICARGDHMDKVYLGVSFCVPHAVAFIAFKICSVFFCIC